MRPIRAYISLARQRVILTVRYWFRLPIDEIRARNEHAMLEQMARAVRTQIAIMDNLQSRLQWYERNIPLIQRARVRFDEDQKRQKSVASTRPAAPKATGNTCLNAPV